MSKKRDPFAVIIHYFTTEELGEAGRALAVIKEIVRSRQPRPVTATPKRKNGPGLPPRRKPPVDVPLPLGAAQ